MSVSCLKSGLIKSTATTATHTKKTYDDKNDLYGSQFVDERYDAYKAGANREGYRLVPLEPTERMLDSAYSSISDNLHYADLENIYKAMIGVVDEST